MTTPVTLITGFLGSGKTTLLRHLLTHSTERIAVVMNEFGDAGIDDQLILRSDEAVIELTTGSICCAAKNDTIQVLETLLDRKGGAFDRVVIETTGLAHPVGILRAFEQKPLLKAAYTLESVVTVVDARLALEQAEAHREWHAQVAVADLLLVSKADLTPPEVAGVVERRLREVNPAARLFRLHQGVIDPAIVFAPGLFADERPITELTETDEAHTHHQTVRSLVLSSEKPLDRERFLRFVADKLVLHEPALLRFKGFVRFADRDEPLVFQGVERTLDQHTDPRPKDKRSKMSQLVVIGSDLNETTLRTEFAACIA